MRRGALRIGIICLFIIICVIVSVLFMEETVTELAFDTEIEVQNGELITPENVPNQIEIEEAGNYVVHVECVNDKEGLLTAFVLYNEDDEIAFFCSGEAFSADSEELELKEGTYRAEIQYITNETDWKQLVEAGKGEIVVGDENYSFAENGTWNLQVQYQLVQSGTVSLSYIIGLVVGLIVGIGLFALIMYIIRKAGGKLDWNGTKNSYDERQMLARGVAYKYAFFTLVVGVVLAGLLSELAGIKLFMSLAGSFAIIFVSIGVFVTVCILKDAYMSLYENVKGVVMMFAMVGLLNIGIGITNIVHGYQMIDNGMLSTNCLNLIVGVMFIYVLVVFVARVIYNNRQLEEDEE